MQWEYDVRIERTVSGHRVIARDIDTGRLRTVRRSRKALTWRTALVDLLEVEETWLWGDFLSDVEVSGVSGWQADMLRLAACRLEGSPSREVRLLMKLSDRAIERFAERWGSLVTEPALNEGCCCGDVGGGGRGAGCHQHAGRRSAAETAGSRSSTGCGTGRGTPASWVRAARCAGNRGAERFRPAPAGAASISAAERLCSST